VLLDDGVIIPLPFIAIPPGADKNQVEFPEPAAPTTVGDTVPDTPLQSVLDGKLNVPAPCRSIVTEVVELNALHPPDAGTEYVTVYGLELGVDIEGLTAPVVELIESPDGALNVPAAPTKFELAIV
jgi:hypothetical protein